MFALEGEGQTFNERAGQSKDPKSSLQETVQIYSPLNSIFTRTGFILRSAVLNTYSSCKTLRKPSRKSRTIYEFLVGRLARPRIKEIFACHQANTKKITSREKGAAAMSRLLCRLVRALSSLSDHERDQGFKISNHCIVCCS